MASVNKVILVGNVGKDPETRYAPSGGAIVNLSIATTDSWKDKQTGQKQEKTEWHRLVAFGKLAEIVGQYVKKGEPIYVEGSLRYGQYEKDGITRYTTDIVMNQMQMLGRKDAGGSGMREEFSNQQKAQPSTTEPSIVDDEDVPF